MKIAAWIALLVSLGANAALFLTSPRGQGADGSTAVTNASSQDLPATSGEVGGARDAAGRSSSTATAAVSAEAWTSLQSDDLATLVANLRAAGFPPDVLRAIVGKRVSDLFAARRREVAGPEEIRPFWDPRRSRYASERSAKLRPLAKEEQQMLKDLLGSDATGDDFSAYQRRRFGFLAADKVDAVSKIETDYSELSGNITREAVLGVRLPEDREKLALIEKEKRADLVAILSPAELEQYDLYLSPTAQNMRNQLATFAPTEEEFREIYALRRVMDERFPTQYGAIDPSTMQQRQAADKDLNAQIKSVLGEERFAAYERSLDQGYNSATQITEHFKLPAENAVAVFNLQKAAQDAQNAIQANKPQPDEQSREAMRALAAEMNGRLTTLLTAEGVAAYRQTGGYWLRNLEQMSAPRPAPPPRPPGG